jgi:hypothetical protein
VVCVIRSQERVVNRGLRKYLATDAESISAVAKLTNPSSRAEPTKHFSSGFWLLVSGSWLLAPEF